MINRLNDYVVPLSREVRDIEYASAVQWFVDRHAVDVQHLLAPFPVSKERESWTATMRSAAVSILATRGKPRHHSWDRSGDILLGDGAFGIVFSAGTTFAEREVLAYSVRNQRGGINPSKAILL